MMPRWLVTAVALLMGWISIQAPSKGQVTITAAALTSRSVNPGGSFKHRVTLKNGGSPLAFKDIGVDDPIAKVCWVYKTNAYGQVDVTSTTTGGTPPSTYTFVFLYGQVKSTSTVAVKAANTVNLPNFKMDYISTAMPAVQTLVGGERAPTEDLGQTVQQTVQQAIKLGYDVGTQYLSDPGNLLLVRVVWVTCTAGATIPAGGQAACLTGVTLIGVDIGKQVIISYLNKIVDAANNCTPEDKAKMKALISAGSAAYSIVAAKPAQGFETVQKLQDGYSVVSAAAQFIYAGGLPRGVSVAAQLNDGSGRIIQITCYKR